MTDKSAKTPDGVQVLRRTLQSSLPRPAAADGEAKKTQYAVRFADSIAVQIAKDLSLRLMGISASTKRQAGSAKGHKQLDVNFSTPQLGLALGISLKSVHLRDVSGPKRYTHNMKRNEEELRIEASGYHKRQPYSVMIAVLFLPFDSCNDGKKGPSSFGSWVRHLRPYTGRQHPEEDIDRFESIFIGLYEPSGDALEFFDVGDAPPMNARPTDTRSYAGFLDHIYHLYLRRNSAEFAWAEGGEAPLNPAEDEPDDDAT